MSEDKDSKLVVSSNEYSVAASLISLHGDNIEDSDKQGIVTNIEFEAITPSIKNNFFHQHMMDFMNKLELSDQKFQTNWIIRDKHYKGKFLFPTKDFVSFGTDRQSMYFISTRFLKYKIGGFHVPQFQLAYICSTTHLSRKYFVKLCHKVHYMWWTNQDLGLQEWEDCINPNKTRILAIIMLVPNNNPQG